MSNVLKLLGLAVAADILAQRTVYIFQIKKQNILNYVVPNWRFLNRPVENE